MFLVAFLSISTGIVRLMSPLLTKVSSPFPANVSANPFLEEIEKVGAFMLPPICGWEGIFTAPSIPFGPLSKKRGYSVP